MNQLIITPKSIAELHFLKKLLNNISSVEEVISKPLKNRRKRRAVPFAAISQSALAKEWLSSEDEVWDEWYREMKKSGWQKVFLSFDKKIEK